MSRAAIRSEAAPTAKATKGKARKSKAPPAEPPKRGRGRPRRSEDVSTKMVNVRMTDEQFATLEGDAGARGMSVSEYLRACWQRARVGRW